MRREHSGKSSPDTGHGQNGHSYPPACPARRISSHGGEADDVVASVDVENLAGDSRSQVRAQESGGIADFFGW